MSAKWQTLRNVGLNILDHIVKEELSLGHRLKARLPHFTCMY